MRRKALLDLREIIIRLRKKQSIREIKRENGASRPVIREMKELAKEHGWLKPDVSLPAESDIAVARYGEHWEKPNKHPLDKYKSDFKHYLKEEYSFVVIHQLIKDKYPCSEATVRRYVHSRFPKKAKAVIRRETFPGKIMEVDFGYLGFSWDTDTGRRRKTWVFSGRLAHSRHAYREKVYDQKAETFFMCHIHAFEYFGGVPEKVVPDNLKAAVIRACIHEPLLNRAYKQLAEHYGFMISPCLPRKPEHKGGVENDIKYIKGNFLPLFKEKLRELGREIATGDELQEALEDWNRKTAMVRKVKGIGRQPIEIFETDEKDTLNPLPETRWDPVTWKKCHVSLEWRVQFEKAYYSVPYKLRQEKVYVCGNSTTVWIFYNYKEVTMHRRARYEWEFVKKAEHAPPEEDEYLATTRSGLLLKAARIDIEVSRVVKKIFDDKVYDGLRPVRGILFSLPKKYGIPRLVKACARAIYYETVSYRSIKTILEKELDVLPLEEKKKPVFVQQNFHFAREQGFFSSEIQF